MERSEAAPVPGRLEDRILETLLALPGRIAFNGLRRSLRAHPESLSRALRRLEREGLIEHGGDGYRAVSVPAGGPVPEDWRTIAQVDLPLGADAETLFARLTGRWFGSLRWVGVIDLPQGRRLAWNSRDGGTPVLLAREGRRLQILSPLVAGVPEEGDADDAAYELLVAVAEALRSPTDVGAPGLRRLAAEPGRAGAWPGVGSPADDN